MAHNIELENGYIGRQSAWHGLGTVTGDYINKQTLVEQGIIYTPTKEQLEYKGAPIDAYGIFHPNGTFIACCGENYEICPGSVLTDTMEDVLGDDVKYETAGILGTYQKVWVLVDVKATMRVGDDILEPYLAGATSFDGSMATKFWQTVVRIICQNTMNMSLNSAAKIFSIRHTAKSHAKIRDASAALAAIYRDFKQTEEQLNFLAGRMTGSVDATLSLLDAVLDMPVEPSKPSKKRDNILADILELYERNDDNAFPEQRGTCYNLLNAITEYTDHYRTTRTRDEDERDNMRFTASLFGSGDKLKSRAMEVITEYAGGAVVKPVNRIITGFTPESTSILDEIVNAN